MSRPPHRRLLVCAPRTVAPALAELAAAWRDAAVDVVVETYAAAPPDAAALAAVAERGPPLDAVLLAGPARRAPATVLGGPFVRARDGRRIPVAWLPSGDLAAVRRFAAAAARVQRRGGTRRAVALLGQWLPNYLRVADRMHDLARGGGVRAFRWTGDALRRDDMVAALGAGLGLALYVGHGRPVGWVGYHGVRAHHFAAPPRRAAREPMGAILSLCCRTASRRRVGLSYAEALPLLGVAAASFGAVRDTLHVDNTRWAVGVCSALASGATTVGELLVRAAPASPAALDAYRLIGDPLAPLGCDDPAMRRAGRVRTHAGPSRDAPDAPATPSPESMPWTPA